MKKARGASFYLMIVLLIIFGIRLFNPPSGVVETKNFSEFSKDLDQGSKIKSVNINEDSRIAVVTLNDDNTYKVVVPSKGNSAELYMDKLSSEIKSKGIEVTFNQPDTKPFYLELIPSFLMLILFGFIWFNFIQNAQGGGKMNSFGKSKARVVKPEEGGLVTFSQVAGLKEEKEELQEIVDFLKNPSKFTKIGARIPKGVLMVGPPGTGKTYLSRAVAGEAKVPFFLMSGSDFVEMFVGVGASRVRDLFDTAKKNAPCIIFIDEIDAVGRRRGAGLGGGHDEREQTLNQLLIEMDGFGKNEGVIVMAATNRADILDPALLRPGRFDRTVYIGKPDVRGREEVLKVHAHDKPLAEDIDFKVIAKQTPGFSPADLENLMNEAALLAARRNQSSINMEDVEEAAIKVQAGPAKKSRVISDKERKLTAVHESGHAVVAQLLPNHDPVHMITIIPRGMAGGFTAYIPEDDVNYMTKKEMEDNLVSLLGGRVAESLVLDDISTGASNDIERATALARAMVTKYGMSEKLGTITYGSDEDEVFVGRDLNRSKNYSDKTASEIDEEISRIISEAYNKAKNLLSDNLDTLIRVSDVLLEKETIDRTEFLRIFNNEENPNEDAEDKHIKEEDLSEEAKSIIEKE
ncbi:ATP-dependent zinc metalloprotease FtsH [Peptoniphilus duerdenii]|uniref:ATP-dependent zinc metalloprotease FtsH n=1 Tax=Peptoniphilus duerdenii TaxID=507750 RepID=UPI00288A6680|nr:ATP-dependent zinc metalloprotease FtsH [Peptoniphilus duerdenii]